MSVEALTLLGGYPVPQEWKSWIPQTLVTATATAGLYTLGAHIIRVVVADNAELATGAALAYYVGSAAVGGAAGICADRAFSSLESWKIRAGVALATAIIPATVALAFFGNTHAMHGSNPHGLGHELVSTPEYWSNLVLCGPVASGLTWLGTKIPSFRDHVEPEY